MRRRSCKEEGEEEGSLPEGEDVDNGVTDADWLREGVDEDVGEHQAEEQVELEGEARVNSHGRPLVPGGAETQRGSEGGGGREGAPTRGVPVRVLGGLGRRGGGGRGFLGSDALSRGLEEVLWVVVCLEEDQGLCGPGRGSLHSRRLILRTLRMGSSKRDRVGGPRRRPCAVLRRIRWTSHTPSCRRLPFALETIF